MTAPVVPPPRSAVRMGLRQLSLPGSAPVEFGAGAIARLPLALAALGVDRVFLVTDPGLTAVGVVARVLGPLGEAGVDAEVYDQVHANPSTEDVVAAAAAGDRLLERGRTGLGVLAVGGGSALDVAKGVGLLLAAEFRDLTSLLRAGDHPGVPLVAVPTTAGTGAETNGFGVLADPVTHTKVYLGADSVRPRLALLDPELTIGVPPSVTAATGMDALVHGIESLASAGAHPLSEAYAARAVRLVDTHLERAVADGTDLEARTGMLLGAHLAGRALTLSGLGLVHGIAHATTGHTGAPHGLALSAVLDAVMDASAPAADAAFHEVAAALGIVDRHDPVRAAIDRCRQLAETVGARRSLGELGASAAMLPSIAADALADPVSRNAPWLPGSHELTDLLAGRL